MRRIIERIVTTVTTTTWKISWETDTPHASRDHRADSVSNDLPHPDVLTETAQSSQTIPPVIEVKEVHPSEIEKAPDPLTDEPQ